MIKNLRGRNLSYKLSCDGYDLSRKLDGMLVGPFGRHYAKKHCRVAEFPFAEEFISKCIINRKSNKPELNIKEEFCDKYEVGYFETKKHNCFDSDYILFNEEQLAFWTSVNVVLWGLKFMVVPSRNWKGEINEIGFRLLNREKVNNVFKWLFMFGQQATFGLHLCDKNKELLLVEGFQDMVAFGESGQSNVVGLGSLDITEAHKAQLQTDDYVICSDMDQAGMSSRKDQQRYCFYKPEGKDPYDVFVKNGKVEPVYVDTNS